MRNNRCKMHLSKGNKVSQGSHLGWSSYIYVWMYYGLWCWTPHFSIIPVHCLKNPICKSFALFNNPCFAKVCNDFFLAYPSLMCHDLDIYASLSVIDTTANCSNYFTMLINIQVVSPNYVHLHKFFENNF